MSRMTGWEAQTKWLTDQHYVSSKDGGIWRDRVTKRDRACNVSDGEMKRTLGCNKVDVFGNVLTTDRFSVAKRMVERLLGGLPAEARGRISAGLKWRIVDLLAAGQGREALALLSA